MDGILDSEKKADLSKAAMYVHNHDDEFSLFDFQTDLNYGEEEARAVLTELAEIGLIRQTQNLWWKRKAGADATKLLQSSSTPPVELPPEPLVHPPVAKTDVNLPLKVLQLDNGTKLDVAEKELKVGIQRTEGFEKKRLAKYAINTGIKCGVGCAYCSTAAMVRTHSVFQEIGRTSSEDGFAVLNLAIVKRVQEDAKKIKLEKRGTIEISTIVDAWAPEALEGQYGRKCLQAVLDKPGWTVRILSKRKEMAECFDLIAKWPERVQVGMSITAMPDLEHLVSVIEPNAASISERMEVMREAKRQGFRVYGMLCPLLPEMGSRPEQLVGLIKFCEEIGAEEIFVENLNARGRSVVACQEALQAAGHVEQAAALERIRDGQGFAEYVLRLVQETQSAMREHSDIRKLRFLLYTKGLPDEIVTQIRQDPDGIVFLDDDQVDISDIKRIPETQSVMPWKGQTPTTKLLALREMTIDFDLQCRKEPDEDQIREYAAEMDRGVQFPPPVLFFDGSSYSLDDGFHRVWAAQWIGLRQLQVQIYEGGPAQAIAYAAGANSQHGMRRTNADKRFAVTKLFVDAALANRSDSVIAEMVGVDHKTVGKVRKELTGSGEIPHFEERIGSDGRKVLVSPPSDQSLETVEAGSLATVAGNDQKETESPPVQSKVWPAYPEGFVEGWEATQILLKDLENFQSVPTQMYASAIHVVRPVSYRDN